MSIMNVDLLPEYININIIPFYKPITLQTPADGSASKISQRTGSGPHHLQTTALLHCYHDNVPTAFKVTMI